MLSLLTFVLYASNFLSKRKKGEYIHPRQS